MSLWYEQMRDVLPNGPKVKELVAAVENLPGLANWLPAGGLANASGKIIKWGSSICMTRSLTGSGPLLMQIGKEIVSRGEPLPNTFAEISGAALCVALGSVAGERLHPHKAKAADWRLIWPKNESVDVEVTAARQKQQHSLRRALASQLADALFNPEGTNDVVVHIADPTVAKDRDEILDAVRKVADGGSVEHSDAWQVQLERISREPFQILMGSMDARPSWWSPGKCRCFIVKSMIAGPETKRAPSQVRIYFGVPYRAYLNPVLHKANRRQGVETLPFLVAVDVAELPGAFEEMPQAVQGYLPYCKRLSGILLYRELYGRDKVGWLWRFVNNPFSDLSLPASFLKKTGEANQTMEIDIDLTASAAPTVTAYQIVGAVALGIGLNCESLPVRNLDFCT